MWFSGRLISQLDHLNRAKDSWRREKEITDTKRDEEVNWGGGTERHDGRQRGRNRHRERTGEEELKKQLRSQRQHGSVRERPNRPPLP